MNKHTIKIKSYGIKILNTITALSRNGKTITIYRISQETGLSYSTVKRYIQNNLQIEEVA